MERPAIDTICDGAELKRWYWLKAELLVHARALGLRTTGGKFEILERIAHFLDTGEKSSSQSTPPRARSKFDWHAEPLNDQTVLTDSYKSTQNVRSYFETALGDGFKFNIEFMAWLKANGGKTLGDACEEYRAMKLRESAPGFKSKIEPHNQFNQFTRDFLADNPDLGMQDVRRIWAAKIKRPSEDGRHVYDPKDRDLD